MKIKRLEIADLWSYGGPGKTVLGDFGLVNVIIGKNNAGKSNLVKIIRETAFFAKNHPLGIKLNWIHNSGSSTRVKTPYLQCSFSITVHDWPTERVPQWISRLRTYGDRDRLNALFTISLASEATQHQVTEDFTWENEVGSQDLIAAI